VLNCSGPEDTRPNPRDAPEASASKVELTRLRMAVSRSRVIRDTQFPCWR
jgi:hypothetical protein